MNKSDKLEAIPLVVFEDKEKLKDFNCQTPVIDKFLHNDALKSDGLGYTSTTIIVNSNDEIVGFYTLNMATETFKVDDGHGVYDTPYVNLAYLAVDYKHCEKGYGRRIVKHIYRKLSSVFLIIGFPYVYVNALTESVDFYKRVGFEMDKATEKTYQEQGCRLDKYEMMIYTNDMLSYITK